MASTQSQIQPSPTHSEWFLSIEGMHAFVIPMVAMPPPRKAMHTDRFLCTSMLTLRANNDPTSSIAVFVKYAPGTHTHS